MAQTTIVTLIDDLDGSTATGTVPFALDGITYDIDLSDTNADRLRAELAKYIDAGRRIGGRTKRRAAAAKGAGPGRGHSVVPLPPHNPAQVRAWARAQGLLHNDRGRIPRDIVLNYLRTHTATGREKKPTSTPPAPPATAPKTTKKKATKAPARKHASNPSKPVFTDSPGTDGERRG